MSQLFRSSTLKMESLNSLQHPSDELEAIDLEVGRLAMLCGLSLLQPGDIKAIFRDDEMFAWLATPSPGQNCAGC